MYLCLGTICTYFVESMFRNTHTYTYLSISNTRIQRDQVWLNPLTRNPSTICIAWPQIKCGLYNAYIKVGFIDTHSQAPPYVCQQ